MREMKRKNAMLGMLLLLCMLVFGGMTGSAESGGGGTDYPIFHLAFWKDGKQQAAVSATLVGDPGSGTGYLISTDAAVLFQEDGYELYLVQGDYMKEATIYAAAEGICLLSADGLENANFYIGDMEGEPDFGNDVILKYENGDVADVNMDLSSWQVTDSAHPYWYGGGAQYNDVKLAGCPVYDKSTGKVPGILSLCQDAEGNTMLMMVHMALIRQMMGQTSEQTEVETEAETYRQTEAETEAQTYRQTEAETEAQTYRQTEAETQAEPYAQPETEAGKTRDPQPSGETGGIFSDLFSDIPVAFIFVLCGIAGAVLTKKQKKEKAEQRRVQEIPDPQEHQDHQTNQNQEPVVIRDAEEKEKRYYLEAISGELRGSRYEISGVCTIGKMPECQVRYPKDMGGISRYHCQVYLDGGRVFLVDIGSSYGTFLANGVRMAKNQPVELQVGDRFYLADPAEMFQVRMN